MEELRIKKCCKCKNEFTYTPEQTWWNENGSVSTRLGSCPICGTIQPFSYQGINNLDVNNNTRFYSYSN